MGTSQCFAFSAVFSKPRASPGTSKKSSRAEAALLMDLFETAKQAGAVKDTSNEDHAAWMRPASVGLILPASRTSSRKSYGNDGAEEFEWEGNSVVSDAATVASPERLAPDLRAASTQHPASASPSSKGTVSIAASQGGCSFPGDGAFAPLSPVVYNM
ncbi:hypothetical protein T484DRAFT_2135409 [Baffinella frigidus]|nr:hypothetical protein T484DRAFT_2135409 [Cryptophyta sp. CCMP2293]